MVTTILKRGDITITTTASAEDFKLLADAFDEGDVSITVNASPRAESVAEHMQAFLMRSGLFVANVAELEDAPDLKSGS